MLRKSQILVMFLFIINESSHQSEQSSAEGEKSQTSADFDKVTSLDPFSTHRPVKTNSSKPTVKKKEPITITSKFNGNNGRVHKLFYIVQTNGPNKIKKAHEVKLRMRRDIGAQSELSSRWRAPRDHQFVTKSQLKIDRVFPEDPPPVIKVYNMQDDSMSKVIRAGKSRDFGYTRNPTKRIIYYATLPEIIRRPVAPEWLGRQAGAFTHRGIGSSYSNSLLPPFASTGGGPDSADIARIQSAIMDIRPSRDQIGSVSPQFTVVDIDRYPSLNEISSTNSLRNPQPASTPISSNELTIGNQALNDNDHGSGITEAPLNQLLPPLNNNYISNLVTPLQMGGPFTGYQPAPYYNAPFPTRHDRFPFPNPNFRPYQSPLSSLTNGLPNSMHNSLTNSLANSLSNSLTNRPDYKSEQPNSYYNPGLSNFLSTTKLPFYYEYTSSRIDPLKNHLLFSPTWSTPYEKVNNPSSHSSHTLTIDSQSININSANVTTGNSTRITPPTITNVTEHYESREQ